MVVRFARLNELIAKPKGFDFGRFVIFIQVNSNHRGDAIVGLFVFLSASFATQKSCRNAQNGMTKTDNA